MREMKNQGLVVTSCKIPLSLSKQLDRQVIADDYGMKGKGRWVREAIEQLLSFPGYIEFVGLSDEMSGESKTLSVRLPRALMLRIEEAVAHIREKHPMLEGVKSRITRTSILQRIIRANRGESCHRTNL